MLGDIAVSDAKQFAAFPLSPRQEGGAFFILFSLYMGELVEMKYNIQKKISKKEKVS